MLNRLHSLLRIQPWFSTLSFMMRMSSEESCQRTELIPFIIKQFNHYYQRIRSSSEGSLKKPPISLPVKWYPQSPNVNKIGT